MLDRVIYGHDGGALHKRLHRNFHIHGNIGTVHLARVTRSRRLAKVLGHVGLAHGGTPRGHRAGKRMRSVVLAAQFGRPDLPIRLVQFGHLFRTAPMVGMQFPRTFLVHGIDFLVSGLPGHSYNGINIFHELPLGV